MRRTILKAGFKILEGQAKKLHQRPKYSTALCIQIHTNQNVNQYGLVLVQEKDLPPETCFPDLVLEHSFLSSTFLSLLIFPREKNMSVGTRMAAQPSKWSYDVSLRLPSTMLEITEPT